MASLIDEKLSSKMTILPASFEASVPLPIANPTSARFNAGESLTPSPVIPTTRFISWHRRTILDLSVGNALAITRISGRIALTSSSLIGLVAIRDDVRPSAKDAIREVQEAGIQVVMITGDRLETAVAIAKDAGLLKNESDRALSSSSLTTCILHGEFQV